MIGNHARAQRFEAAIPVLRTRSAATAVAIVTGLACLTGCGNGRSGSTASNSAQPKVAQTAPENPASSSCLSKSVVNLKPDLTKVPPKVAAEAEAVFEAAHSCNRAALLRLARSSKTQVSIYLSPDPMFVLPQNAKTRAYDNLIRALSVRAAKVNDGRTMYQWPGITGSAAERQAVKNGLMDPGSDMYYGWRVMITPQGHWDQFVEGD